MNLEELNKGIDKKFDQELLQIARILSPTYKLLKVVGSGGMGNVYLAEAPHLGQAPVAIKVLHPEYALDESLLQRFLREAELLQKVEHPNVVKVYEANSVSGVTFYVMEYAPGKTLESVLKEGPFPISKLSDFILSISGALLAIHQKGIIHRDLKPANIILAENFMPKLMDFGIARPENSQLTHHNEIVGSVCYIAPEIWIGEEPSASVDLYSLGVVLYEMTTGKVPFDGSSPGELMRKHLQQAPVPPKDLQAGMPSYVNRLILRLLSKQKQDRPRDAFEIINIVEKNISVSTENKKFRAYRLDTEEFLRVVDTSSEASLKKQENIIKNRESTPVQSEISKTKGPILLSQVLEVEESSTKKLYFMGMFALISLVLATTTLYLLR